MIHLPSLRDRIHLCLIRGRRLAARKSENGGFALTLSALIITIILASMATALRDAPIPIAFGATSDPRVQQQSQASLMEEMLLAAIFGTGPQNYLQGVSPISALLGSVPSGATTSQSVPQPPPGAIYKAANGTGSPSTITFQGPPGWTVAVADGRYTLVALGTIPSNGTLSLAVPGSVLGGIILIYQPRIDSNVGGGAVWAYSGTISTSYRYTAQSAPPQITTTSWTPPPGYPSVMVYGAPPLSLVQITDSSWNPLSSSVKSPFFEYAALDVRSLSLPMTGGLLVRTPSSWLFTDIKGGDYYAYAPT